MTMKTLVFFIVGFTLTFANEASLQEFVKGNNLFTVSVYKELSKKNNGNFLVSPFSAETVLAVTQAGAKDATAQEIRNALRLPDDENKIESAVKDLQTKLRSNAAYLFQTANKIYVKNNFQINDEFKKVATEVFGADLENIDFLKKVEAADTMNNWVEQQTNNKIHNLINSESLNDRTRAILINALYFKGNWSTHFDAFLTVKAAFYKNSNEVVKVDTMHETDYFKYFESPELNAKILELPFQGEDVSMTIVLPNEKEGLAALESNIDRVFVPPQYGGFENVRVGLPKFKFETEIDFKGLLQNLGVTKAFKAEEADLSGIAGKKGDLVIDKAVQKTFIDVNEEGVEAAAATYVQIGVPLSGFIPMNQPKEFIADHPFIFYIKVKDLIVFAGRVASPST